jgi:sulfur carrier protein
MQDLKLVINGKASFVQQEANISGVIAQYKLDPEAVVVEVNGVIISQDEWLGFRFNDGDKVELVGFVGGG